VILPDVAADPMVTEPHTFDRAGGLLLTPRCRRPVAGVPGCATVAGGHSSSLCAGPSRPSDQGM